MTPGDLAGVDDDTPAGFDVQAVIERWEEIEELGHPFGPEHHDGDQR
jgi:hypothetical protein